ncbi:MAG: HAMP domain-containing histidine kinase [Alphaproteobacteria bacterium]|nr:HAMP domain-containing histidine kinase [Alphaproteobacteria bacterium]
MFARNPDVYRMALGLVCVVLPSLAIAFRLGAPQHGDPTLERFLWAGLALSLIAASWRVAWVERHLGLLCQVFMSALGVWVLYYAAESGFEAPDLGGMLVFQFATNLIFTRSREVVVNTAWWLGNIVLMLVFVAPEPETHPAFLLGLPMAFAFVGGASAWERDRLFATILEQRDHLEVRVEERTRALSREVEQRRSAEAEARSASQAKSAFLTRMSHELRTPINAIVGYTELVREEVDGDLGEDLDRVLDASHQLLRLVDDVLDVSRIERGEVGLEVGDTSLASLVERAVATVRAGVEAGGNTLVVAALPEHTLRVDADRVVQILVNLLHNAGRFTQDGRVEVTAEVDGTTTRIAVHDTGRGIPADLLDRVFEPFFQVDESSVREVDGVGLGLTIARDLAERMGGTLEVRSQVGEGSVFTLVLEA